MSQRDFQTWSAAVLRGDAEGVADVWYRRLIQREEQLPGLSRWCEQSRQAPLLRAALLEGLTAVPQRRQDGARIQNRGFALTLRWRAESCSDFAVKVDVAWRGLLQKHDIQIVAQGGVGRLDLATQAMLFFDSLWTTGAKDSHHFSEELSALDVYSWVADAVTTRVSRPETQTLWVCAPCTRPWADNLLSTPLDAEWYEEVRSKLLEVWREAVDSELSEWVTDDPAKLQLAAEDLYNNTWLASTEAEGLRDQLYACVELLNPLPAEAGWRRQQVQGFLNKLLLSDDHAYPNRAGLIQLTPQKTGTVLGLAWQAERAPSPEALIDVLYEKEEATQRALFLSRADKDGVPPGLTAFWPRLKYRGKALPRKPADPAPTVTRVLAWDTLPLPWDKDVEGWVQQWAEIQPTGLLVGVESVVRAPAEVGQPPAEWLADVAGWQGAVWRGSFESAQDPLTLEEAVFGPRGAALAGSLGRWPENLTQGFRPAASARSFEPGPSVALQLGIGTWVREGLTERARRLLGDLWREHSPTCLTSEEKIVEVLQRMEPQDATALAEFMASTPAVQHLADLDFPWVLAFAVSEGEHALVEVRPALQERLLQTDVDLDVPAWTLRGPAPLTYVQFAQPILLERRTDQEESGYTRKYDTVELLKGSYLWVKEGPEGMSLAVALNLWECLVPTGQELTAAELVALEPSYNNFDVHFWKGIDPEQSVEELVGQLSEEGQASRKPGGTPYAALKLSLQALVKVLLYMGLRDARLETEEKSYSPNAGRGSNAAIAPKRGPGEQRPAILRRIRVGPVRFEDPEPVQGGGDGSRKVSAHWRRGHFRMQPFGQGLRDRRQVWIRPVLVAAAQLHGGPQPVRVYDVGPGRR